MIIMKVIPLNITSKILVYHNFLRVYILHMHKKTGEIHITLKLAF